MKKLPLLLLTICCLFQFSCKKEDGDSRTSKLTAKINGNSFTAGSVTVTDYPGYQIIKAVRSGSSESITIMDSDTAGIYSMGIYSVNGSAADSSQSFSLTTLSNPGSNSSEGEFDFITNDSVLVTEGVFTIFR